MKAGAERATQFSTAFVETSLGRWFVAATDVGVCFLKLNAEGAETAFDAFRAEHLADLSREPDSELLRDACAQLERYANGEARSFDVPLDLRGSDFQRSVWSELVRIPYGVTRTYGEIAQRIGQEGAVRAVGRANGANPVPVIVPCHRVLAKGGLGGFTGGLEHKHRLLALEGVLLPLD